jgi:hypothetical protein
MRFHILSEKGRHPGAATAKELGYNKAADRRRLLTDPACRADLLEVLRRANTEEPHVHERPKKYLLTQKPLTPLAHDHVAYKRPGALRKHLERYHASGDVHGWHTHDGERYALVEIKDVDPEHEPGKRIDVHPLARDLFTDAQVVFLVIEGKLKNDALLTAILETGLPAAVANVPSVTMWEAIEFERVAATWRDKRVVVVPDADWFLNPNVDFQALLLRTRLRRLRVATHIAAPPEEGLDAKIKGVDDFLAAGGSLGDLVVRDVEAPNTNVKAGQKRQLRGRRKDLVARDAEALEALSIHAGALGRLETNPHALARIVEDPEHVKRAVVTLGRVVDTGAVVVSAGSLELAEGRYVPKKVAGLTWKKQPTFDIAPEFTAQVGKLGSRTS